MTTQEALHRASSRSKTWLCGLSLVFFVKHACGVQTPVQVVQNTRLYTSSTVWHVIKNVYW